MNRLTPVSMEGICIAGACNAAGETVPVMALELTYYPDPILKQRASPVTVIDAELRALIEEMFDLMYESHGIGLAAPQVARSMRLFVINVAGDPEEGEELIYINPRIESAAGEVIDEEGCLSIPDVRGKVTRSERVVIKAQGLDGQWFTQEADDLLARAIQHELDHLDGILFIQRLSAAEQLLVKPALKKLAAKYTEDRSPGSRPPASR